MRTLWICLAALTLPVPATAAPDAADRYLHDVLQLDDYRRADADLNGDGRREVVALTRGPAHCGSGGCDLYVLTRRAGRYVPVLRASVSRAPIWRLAGTSHGWHDLGITVAGGGIRHGYLARLRFNGSRYPGNPSVAPAVRPAGMVLLP